MNSDYIPKRRRVAKACSRCRNLKVKCDGKTPICTRCHNYGYECAWSDQTSRHSSSASLAASSVNTSQTEVTALRSSLLLYDELVQNIQGRVITGQPIDAASLGISRDQIKSALPSATLTAMQVARDSTPADAHLSSESPQNIDHPIIAERFVGVASDLHFFNVIKRSFGGSPPREGSEQSKDDFEQYDVYALEEQLDATLAQVPERAVADQLVDTYFTTIHIAYPFLCKPLFLRKYEQFWTQSTRSLEDPVWLSLLHTMFAIGLYYQSFLHKSGVSAEQGPSHEHHFVRALALQARRPHESSLSKVHLLLVQCFYMLATGKTDRCFVALGFAVRLGQSIGLHIETNENVTKRKHGQIREETERRTWYSLFVLDRLLMLQLGRPSAIYDGGYFRTLPSTNDDSTFEVDNDVVCPLEDSGKTTQPGLYFLAVIELSGIIGRVFQSLYAPARDKQEPALMFRAMEIDQQLTAWKHRLPRVLRFDLGHTFDRCLTYRRQRNALALKYHHLRALIHRPYLCVLHIRHNEPMYMKLLETHPTEVKVMEHRAIHEARSTARLLHTIQDVEELVHDFPWWQMISCLVCASSILVMAAVCSVCERTNRVGSRGPLPEANEDLVDDPSGLDEDAEMCLKVFEALSVHSRAAGRARDMLQRLKTSAAEIQSAFYQNQTDDGLEVVFPQGDNVEQLLQGMPFDMFDWDFELGLINTTQSEVSL